MNRCLFAVLLAFGALLASACSKNDSAGTSEGTGSSAAATSDDCDMQGMDMSKMSAEEHQKMLEKCRQR